MTFIRTLYRGIYNFLMESPSWRYRYLIFAKWVSDHGWQPPMTGRPELFLESWANQSVENSTYSPSFYEKEDNSLRILFHDILPFLIPEDPILEVGCNCGRSLNYLYKLGFKNLSGIEIGQKAVDRMREIFPETFAASRIQVGSAPEVLKTLPTKGFRMVFCHSVLVNIPSKYNYVFEEMARVSAQYIVTIENEASWTSYPRNFEKMFEKQGFKMVVFKYLAQSTQLNKFELAENWSLETRLNNNVLRVFVRV